MTPGSTLRPAQAFALVLCACALTAIAARDLRAQSITLVDAKDKKQVDVLVDGQPFTSYVYWDNQKKPILYPLRTAKGTIVTRGFPLEKVAGERTDHPHHISSWFNYGNINGVDFWNTPPEGVARDPGSSTGFGTIKHAAVKVMKNGTGAGSLGVSMDWIMPDGSKILQQDETM